MTDFLPVIEIRKQLSFAEVNILLENINQKTTHGSFIARLDLLSQNTQDERLQTELLSLIEKVKDLTPQEFAKLMQATLQGDILFPADYVIGSTFH